MIVMLSYQEVSNIVNCVVLRLYACIYNKKCVKPWVCDAIGLRTASHKSRNV